MVNVHTELLIFNETDYEVYSLRPGQCVHTIERLHKYYPIVDYMSLPWKEINFTNTLYFKTFRHVPVFLFMDTDAVKWSCKDRYLPSY